MKVVMTVSRGKRIPNTASQITSACWAAKNAYFVPQQQQYEVMRFECRAM